MSLGVVALEALWLWWLLQLRFSQMLVQQGLQHKHRGPYSQPAGLGWSGGCDPDVDARVGSMLEIGECNDASDGRCFAERVTFAEYKLYSSCSFRAPSFC